MITSGFPRREVNLLRQLRNWTAVKSITHSKWIARTVKQGNRHTHIFFNSDPSLMLIGPR